MVSSKPAAAVEQRGDAPGAPRRVVEAAGDGGLHDVAHDAGAHLALAGGGVDDLGAVAERGVVDVQRDLRGAVEERLDDRRVALEHLVGELDVGAVHRAVVGVDVGAEGLEVLEGGPRGLEGLARRRRRGWPSRSANGLGRAGR